MVEKDIKAISKIINGVLYGTRWFTPMVETIGRYLEDRDYIENKVTFKNLCANGAKTKDSSEPIVVYRPMEETPEKLPYLDKYSGNISENTVNKVLDDLKGAKTRMSSIIEKSYGYKKKKGEKIEQ